MKKINIFCFGFGQVAKNFIKKINTEKFSINLSVTTREQSKAKQFNEIKYNNFIFWVSVRLEIIRRPISSRFARLSRSVKLVEVVSNIPYV